MVGLEDSIGFDDANMNAVVKARKPFLRTKSTKRDSSPTTPNATRLRTYKDYRGDTTKPINNPGEEVETLDERIFFGFCILYDSLYYQRF